ncbi:hypothetical protein DQ04_00271010 [Trypanosoma grayi]|uniref:hypothetical protein n=1 Tax=Trypanosoma grayi TaxID=71804 RepID=UPI0004F4B454|nr:hypothetical protein DQ04_00271010 [Trypanosoma grayi]KEG14867.1 hypothetical protein DQ04_00271010 [Trypanosoma grayi]
MRALVTDVTKLPIAYRALLAEFDIDTGSSLRAKYPPAPPVVKEAVDVEGNTLCSFGDDEEVPPERFYALELDDNYCASHMLPDGAEKHLISRSVFIVNRPKPAIYDRFHVYCFALADTTEPGEVDTRDIGASTHWEWVRNTVADDPFLHEEMQRSKMTGEIIVRSKRTVLLGPERITEPGALQVCPAIPVSVVAFAHQLQIRCTQHEFDSVSCGAFVGRDEVSMTGMAAPSSMYIGGYSFAVLRVDSTWHGFLLQTTHLERLKEVMDTLPLDEMGKGALDGTENSTVPPLYGLCAVVTRKDASVRRGGISKSVALLGPTLVWLEPFFPLLVETALQCCDVKGKTEEAMEQQTALLRRCFDAVKGAATPLMRQLRETDSFLEMEVMRISTRSLKPAHVSYTASPFGTPHYLNIPLSPESSDFTFSRCGLEQMVEVSGASFWTVLMAILLEKRIVILSRQGLPNDVCEAALSLGLIGNLLDPGFTAKKVFPYTSVNGFPHFSSVPGYIVGTLNPIFETQHGWWDVLCDLDNKSVMVSPDGGNGIKTGGVLAHDIQFSREILSKVYRMRAMREPAGERHQAVLLSVEECLGLIIMVSEAYETHGYRVARSMQNTYLTPTILRLRASALRGSMLDDMPDRYLFPGEDMTMFISVAVVRRASSCEESELIYALHNLLGFVRSCKEVLLLLRRMPLALEGLNPLAAQLLHASSIVRQAALELMRRVEVFPPGRAAITAMNSFLFMVYEEASREA